jgi:Spy/CpxP family protein refolding chaperone
MMKTHTNPLRLLTIAGISLLTLPGAFSQAAGPIQPPANPPAGHHHKPPGGGKDHEKHDAMLQNLTDTEKAQLKAANEKIKDDPQLVAAEQAIEDAQTKEAREAAAKAKHQLKRELLLKADPSIQPVLEKLTTPPGKPAA